MNDQNKKQSPNDYQTNAQLGMLSLVGVAALIWKNEDKIRLWFYQNILFLTVAGLGILAMLGMYLWHRFKKKEAEYFERMRALRQVEPKARENDYYKRKENRFERNLDR